MPKTDLSFICETRSSKGLEIFAFPCNNFGGQEPGTNEEIAAFAAKKGATYPVFGKLECENKDPKLTHPLYHYLKSHAPEGVMGQGLKWNFAKFLCDAEGKVIQRYLPITSPKGIEKDIQALLEVMILSPLRGASTPQLF